jgi:hypothetical protein
VDEADGTGVAEPRAPDERGDAGALDDVLAEDAALGEDDALAPLRGPDAEADGEKIAGCVDDDGVVQAATARATQSVKVAAPTAVAAVLTAAPAVVARAFMKPPTNGLFRWPCGRGATHRASDCHKAKFADGSFLEWHVFHLTIRLRE